MKKIKAILALASASLLVACSASIGMSKEDAKKKLEEYSAHVQEKTFTTPRKLSYSSQAVMENSGVSSTLLSTFDIDLDAKCIFSYTSMPVASTTDTGEEGAEPELTEWTPCYWLWSAKEKEEQK